MKKKSCLLLITVLAFMIASCEKTTSPQTSTQPPISNVNITDTTWGSIISATIPNDGQTPGYTTTMTQVMEFLPDQKFTRTLTTVTTTVGNNTPVTSGPTVSRGDYIVQGRKVILTGYSGDPQFEISDDGTSMTSENYTFKKQ